MASRKQLLFCWVMYWLNYDYVSSSSGPTLLVLCTKDFIRINVLLNYYNFFGVIYTRPSRNTCSVQGVGEEEMRLFVPLSEPGRTDCGVALQDDFYSVVIDIRKHHVIEMASDTSFLVQCSASQSSTLKPSPKTDMALEILEDDKPVRETVVGRPYTVQLEVPNNYYYEVRSCLAFSGDDTIKFVPLMDSSGCPIEDMITQFIPVYGSKTVRAEITMFKFNDSTDFHIQCTVSKCEDKCVKPICRRGTDSTNLYGPRVLAQNSEEGFAAFRVSVLEQSQTSTQIQYTGCNYSDEPSLYGLIILLLLLVFLTFVLCSLAFYNRPFKCMVQERDGVSVHEELIQIVDEPPDHWSFLSRLKFIFPLALPSTQQLVISTLPSDGTNASDEDDSQNVRADQEPNPIVHMPESVDSVTEGGSTLRSRQNPTEVLSGKSSVTRSVSFRSTQRDFP